MLSPNPSVTPVISEVECPLCEGSSSRPKLVFLHGERALCPDPCHAGFYAAALPVAA